VKGGGKGELVGAHSSLFGSRSAESQTCEDGNRFHGRLANPKSLKSNRRRENLRKISRRGRPQGGFFTFT